MLFREYKNEIRKTYLLSMAEVHPDFNKKYVYKLKIAVINLTKVSCQLFVFFLSVRKHLLSLLNRSVTSRNKKKLFICIYFVLFSLHHLFAFKWLK